MSVIAFVKNYLQTKPLVYMLEKTGERLLDESSKECKLDGPLSSRKFQLAHKCFSLSEALSRPT